MDLGQTNKKNIQIIRTNNGEVFIGNLKGSENGSIDTTLEDSFAINVIPNENSNDFNIMLVPVFSPIDNQPVDLNISNNILSKISPNQELLIHYNDLIKRLTETTVSENIDE